LQLQFAELSPEHMQIVVVVGELALGYGHAW